MKVGGASNESKSERQQEKIAWISVWKCHQTLNVFNFIKEEEKRENDKEIKEEEEESLSCWYNFQNSYNSKEEVEEKKVFNTKKEKKHFHVCEFFCLFVVNEIIVNCFVIFVCVCVWAQKNSNEAKKPPPCKKKKIVSE